MEFHITLDKQDLPSLNKTIRAFNQHFKSAANITLEIDNIGPAALHYFFTHIKFTWDDFKDKVKVKGLDPEQIMIYAGAVFGQKEKLAFQRKVRTGYIFGVTIFISIVLVFTYIFINNNFIKPYFDQRVENAAIKTDASILLKYCLGQGWTTNRINFFIIAKEVRRACRVYYKVPRIADYAIIMQESECQINATHTNWWTNCRTGEVFCPGVDRGLMQIDSCHNGMEVGHNISFTDDIAYIPEYNIRAGTSILATALDKNNGDILYALKGYNTCPDLTYSDQVINRYFILTKMFDR